VTATTTPATRYAKSGDLNIAYQVFGDGATDLVYTPGFLSQVEWIWEYPPYARFLRRLGSFGRVILLDKRGTGLSDPVKDTPTLEERMDDVRVVLDAVGSERATLFGVAEGGPMCVLLAATYPERFSSLVLYASLPKFTQDDSYEWGWTSASIQLYLSASEGEWGSGFGADFLAPSLAGDEGYRQWFARLLRLSASPGMALDLLRMNTEIDVRSVLPSITVPTLLLHRSGDRFVTPAHSGYMAKTIPHARYVPLAGDDHWPWAGDAEALLDEVQEFVTGERASPDPDRVLATILFIDVVSSTETAFDMGDRRWRDVLEQYYTLVRREFVRHRGTEVNRAGDGFLASFDGPARAVKCACAINDAVSQIGLQVRSGIHTGECERLGHDLGGVAVHIAARVLAAASPREVLVSSTVKDLVAGASLSFEDRGRHDLKGVPGTWRLFAATEH
jgi:class 3 adenylate cyclase